MKIYDSYNKDYKTIEEKEVNIYNCGPTVYNDIHIGNARPLIVFDVLYRYLNSINKTVKYIHNLTDIDDKIINKAIGENVDEKTISDRYIDAYAKIRSQLNTLPLNTPKITDHINGIIDYIDRMIKNGTAYSIDGNVYFNIAKIKDYGKLSNKKIDELENGERVSIDDKKINPGDFVLWKKTNVGIQWETEWAKGRPGWHSECSYLIEKYFGDNLTIHGGGVDLKFPHHENENAQNCALHNKPLAKIWMHVGHVNINNEKMSKSLNNFVLMKELLEKYDYQTIRWFFYSTNYRNPLNFSFDILDQANNEIKKIKKSIYTNKTNLILNNALVEKNEILDKEFLNELDNDLNIVNAITIIQKNIKELNQKTRSKEFNESNNLLNYIINSLKILGIEFEDIHNDANIKLIKDYKTHIDNKQFDKSDEIRKILIDKELL